MGLKTTSRAGAISLMAMMCMSACGGGGDSSGGGGVLSPGGTSVNGEAFGQITQMANTGTVSVNGVEFTLTGSAAGAGLMLNIGQVIKLQGTINATTHKGSADSLVYESLVEGPVSLVNKTSKTFKALNQNVEVNYQTVFDGFVCADLNACLDALDALSANDGVVVSGYVDSTGTIRATYVGKLVALSASSYRLLGVVSNRGVGTFTLASTSVTNNSGGATPNDNDCVSIAGSYASNVFTANIIQPAFTCLITSGADGDRGELEGLIASTPVPTTTMFKLDGITVDASHSPTYVNGSSTGLTVDTQVLVSGAYSGGVLVASKITYE